MSLNRRDFLIRSTQLTTSVVLGSLFPSLRIWGVSNREPAPNHLFVLLRTFGGMDVTLGLDPQILPAGADELDMFLEYRPEEILQAGDLRFGPAAKPLLPWAAECLIVNGVMMRRDAGHDVINQYMITGRGDGKSGVVSAELGLAMGLSPFGLVSNSSVYVAGKAVNLSTTQDIISETDQSLLIEWIEERLKFLATLDPTPLEEAEKQMVAGKAAAAEIQRLLEGFKKEFGKLEDKHALAAAFAAGGSQQAMLDINAQALALDTHSNHAGNHLRAQMGVWQAVADVFSLFKKVPYLDSSLFDHTTFMVASEWSRTPALNAAKGKDHNPFTNSVLFAGKGIQKGKVLGKSRLITRKQTGKMSDHIAWPYHYKEQKLADKPEGASFFYPENVIRSVGQIFGNPSGFKPVPETVPMIPGLART